MGNIIANTKNIKELLTSDRYSIEYYQREYRWQEKHVIKMLDDIQEKFLGSYDANQGDRGVIQSYGPYFLGSIIISKGDSGQKFITDGQQRLTSLTLLLIYIYHQLEDTSQKAKLSNLIRSDNYGRISFSINVEERTECMDALFNGDSFDVTDESESVINIVGRYEDIKKHFPSDLSAKGILWFSDWLIEKVYMVEIEASSDSDAYTIFEVMNDRGLSLSPTDMLKGYLLSNIEDGSRRNSANDTWREIISSLQDIGKDEDSDAIKAWLRSQYARKTRERKRNAQPEDYELIGTEFHRWVKDHSEILELSGGEAYHRFIMQEFKYYSRLYEKIRSAEDSMEFAKSRNLESIHYNAHNNFTLQYPVLMSSIERGCNEDDAERMLRIVSTYIDILIARRIWNGMSFSYTYMQYNMFQLMLEIRGQSREHIIDVLINRLENDSARNFASNKSFALTGRNGPQVHYLLARMSSFVREKSDMGANFSEYIKRSGRREEAYEIEHIWANHPERHTDEFTEEDFSVHRNWIGGLLILPKLFNASFGDMPYSEKYEHYFGQTSYLAKSLHENMYENNPGFLNFVRESGIPFQSHPEFKKADLDKRQELYTKLAELIWNPENLREL